MKVIDAAHQDEQGERLPGPRPGGGGLMPITAVKSPLDMGSASDIVDAAGLGPHRNLSQGQFKMPGQNSGDATGAEGGAAEAGAGEAAAGAGAGEAIDLLALAAL